MHYHISDIRSNVPQTGKVIIYWLGGSGFAFKFADGKVICIDPYLSDAVERLFNFKRLSLSPVSADELKFDTLLITHDHADHLDMDSINALITGNRGCKIIASESSVKALDNIGIAAETTTPGAVFHCGNVDVEVVDADHGELCADAVGFLIKFGGRSIYFTGDTGYNPEMMAKGIAASPEILIPCINGAFGNLTEEEAAGLAAQCSAKVTIPSHFWLFAEHGGSPGAFKDAVSIKSPNTNVILLTPGQGIEV
ncbi:MAG: MBL fold metallo-hydrolase [Armatimonadota bacterium]|nr:MBL fold metallo-hydrolase [bacterium]